MRFLLRSMAEVFGMVGKIRRRWAALGAARLSLDAAERHAEQTEQFATFFVVVGRRDDGDIEAHRLLDVFHRDFRENREVGDAEVVVPLAVELRRDAAEIANGRKRHGEQPMKEFPHRVAAKRDAAADDLAFGFSLKFAIAFRDCG